MSTSVFLNIQLKSCLHEKLGFDTNGTPYPQGLNDLSVFFAVIPNTGLNNNKYWMKVIALQQKNIG